MNHSCIHKDVNTHWDLTVALKEKLSKLDSSSEILSAEIASLKALLQTNDGVPTSRISSQTVRETVTLKNVWQPSKEVASR